MNYVEWMIFIVIGSISGFINTVASSGTAVTLPIMIFCGIDPIVANATNRLPVFVGFTTSVFNFSRSGKIPWKTSLLLAIPVGIGTTIGAIFVGSLPNSYTEIFVSIALLISFILILINPRKFIVSKNMGIKKIDTTTIVIMFAIGIWAGVIVLDSAIFVLFTLVLLMGYELIKANAIKSVLILTVGLVSIIAFLYSGKIDWTAGLLLSIGSVAGSYLGSNFAMQESSRKWVFLIIKLIIFIELILLISKMIRSI